MSADEFLADSKPGPLEKEKDYDAAAAHYYQIAIMQAEDIEETEWVGILASRANHGRALNGNDFFFIRQF